MVYLVWVAFMLCIAKWQYTCDGIIILSFSVSKALWYKMILPPQFDRSKKYPLLIQVYVIFSLV